MVNGNRFILMMIDYFSKWAEAYALPQHKAETVADCIVNHWIAHHGIPIRKHSYDAPELRGHVITRLSMNGICKHMNQTIENIIKCTVREE